MTDTPKYDYSSLDIHLPQRKALTSRLQQLSFIINDIILAISLLALLGWCSSLFFKRTTIIETLHVYPFAFVQFLLVGSSLLFSAKRHFFNPKDNTLVKQPGWTIIAPILFAAMAAVFGFIDFSHLNQVFPAVSTTAFSGFCFFIIGLALIPPHTRLPHRFHITQFLVFGVLVVNLFTVLENVFQVLSSQPFQHIMIVPLPTAFIFVLFCLGILWRWSNRGFFGNFTIASDDSVLALRSLLANFISTPTIAFIVLAITRNSSYNVYQIVTLVITGIALVTALIIWINIKVLYKHDLEHYLLKESLRVHNVDLTLEKKAQEVKMKELDQEKQRYLEKLNYQNTFQNVAERLD